MSKVVVSFQKSVIERRRLFLDYGCWLSETEKLTAFQAFVAPFTEAAPLNVDIAYTDAAQRMLTMFASGGTGNTSYVIQMQVSTDGGRIKRDDVAIRVTP